MSYRKQIKFFDDLKRYQSKFDRKELEDFNMLLKRHKDDEDLDKLSFERLSKLHEKYHVNRPKPNLDNLFKKNDSEQE